MLEYFENSETELERHFFFFFLNETFQWILNPFVKNIKMQHLISLCEELIDIGEDGNLQAEFQQNPLHNWRMGLKN